MHNLEALEFFLIGDFSQGVDYEDLNNVISTLKETNVHESLIAVLNSIIKHGDYEKIALFIKEHGERTMRPHKAELFVKFLYARLTNTPTEMTPWILQRIE